MLMVTGGRLPIGSLGAFVDRFRFNSPIFTLLEQLAHPRIAAALAVIVGLAIAAWLRTRRSIQAPETWGWPMAGALLAAPMICPWYLVWLTPFLWNRWSAPLLAWSLSVLAVYLVWYLRSLDGSWIVPVPLLTLEYGAVAVAALWLAMGLTRNLYPETRGGAARRRRRSPSRLHSPCHLVTLSPASCCVGHPWALRAGGGAVRIPQSEGR